VLLMSVTLAISSHAQEENNSLTETYCNLLANDLIERTDGYLQNDTLVTRGEDCIAKSILIGLPASYNFDLMRMDVRLMAQSYFDVTIASLWQRGYDGAYHIELSLPYNLAGVIYYSRKVKTIILTIAQEATTNQDQ